MKKIIGLLLVLVVFISVLVISYLFINVLTQRAYSFPLYEANPSNSTQGGEAFDDENLVFDGVVVYPHPGATDVSLDTVIYVFEMRSGGVIDLQLNPKTSFYDVKDEDVDFASGSFTFYPAELLQPETTYNMSGSMYDLSVWWTFTTGSSIIPQSEYEYISSPYTWWIAIIVASIPTIIIAKKIWKTNP